MHRALPLRFAAFGGADDPLLNLAETRQVRYLRCYLNDLVATSALVEDQYFDHDYLAEFSAFYSQSAAGYPNICKRVHFFDASFTRELWEQSLGDDEDARRALQGAYLGFVVVRPIPQAPLGKTVLRWYPDSGLSQGTPRVLEPSREYVVHVAGIALTVEGVAWQQQDSAVGACATVALWSTLHSSAFDEHHAVPTTAAITAAAHRTASLGSRMFPSGGLRIQQLLEAIKEHELSPVLLEGEKKSGRHSFFKRERFCSTVAAFVRSGYPVILIGNLAASSRDADGRPVDGRHAVCVTGFRTAGPVKAPPGGVTLHDASAPFIYLHDDNLGPSVRFRVVDDPAGHVTLKAEAPVPLRPRPVADPTVDYPQFTPTELVVAVQHELRTSPDKLNKRGTELALWLSKTIAKREPKMPGLTVSVRFVRLVDYLGAELSTILSGDRDSLARARRELVENVPPMSRHLGLVRIGDAEGQPLSDTLFDTTDCDRHLPAFATVVYYRVVDELIAAIETTTSQRLDFGVMVRAFSSLIEVNAADVELNESP